jgi:hypothetical protein
MACVHCKRLISLAITATREYHGLASDLECAYLAHDLEAPLLLSIRLEKALSARDSAIADLSAHENTHRLRKPVDEVRLSKRQTA